MLERDRFISGFLSSQSLTRSWLRMCFAPGDTQMLPSEVSDWAGCRCSFNTHSFLWCWQSFVNCSCVLLQSPQPGWCTHTFWCGVFQGTAKGIPRQDHRLSLNKVLWSWVQWISPCLLLILSLSDAKICLPPFLLISIITRMCGGKYLSTSALKKIRKQMKNKTQNIP